MLVASWAKDEDHVDEESIEANEAWDSRVKVPEERMCPKLSTPPLNEVKDEKVPPREDESVVITPIQ